MSTGVVKWFNNSKHYGFIQGDDGKGDVFVHQNAVDNSGMNDLQEGDRISYDLETRKGKTSAVNLKLV